MSYIDSFKDKVVWITGASSGIGEQLTYQLCSAGAKLILSSRNASELKRVAAKCDSDDSVRILTLDLNENEKLKDKCREAIDIFGRIDFLFNIAGVAHRDLAFNTDMSVDRKLMQINYFGTIELSKIILLHMIERGGGHIVVTSSLSGKYGVPLLSAYSASKHALHGFFESVRAEMQNKNIRITIVIPGFIKTPITQNALTGDGSAYGKMLEIQEKGMPADVCAKKILSAVANAKEEVFVGRSERFSLLFSRLLPRTFSKFIKNHPLKKLRKMKELLVSTAKSKNKERT